MSNNYISVQPQSKKFSRQPELTQLQLIKALVEGAPNATFCIGSEGQFLYANRAICILTEYSCQELLSKTLTDIEPDLAIAQWSTHWRSLQQKGNLTLTSRYQTKSGRIIPVDVVIKYVEEQSREFCCIFATQKSEESLRLESAAMRDQVN